MEILFFDGKFIIFELTIKRLHTCINKICSMKVSRGATKTCREVSAIVLSCTCNAWPGYGVLVIFFSFFLDKLFPCLFKRHPEAWRNWNETTVLHWNISNNCFHKKIDFWQLYVNFQNISANQTAWYLDMTITQTNLAFDRSGNGRKPIQRCQKLIKNILM